MAAIDEDVIDAFGEATRLGEGCRILGHLQQNITHRRAASLGIHVQFLQCGREAQYF